jgi:cation:H+ antiporter
MTPAMPVAMSALLSALLIVAAGTLLARSGDAIAARTNLGGMWIGSVFLALATSLPELSTDVAAVRIHAPDLAVGDVFGSSMANMLILAIINLLPPGSGLFRKATLDHALYASIAIILTCIAAIIILVHPTRTYFGFGPGSFLLVVVYLVGSRAVFRRNALAQRAARTEEMSGPPRAHDVGRQAPEAAPPQSLRRAALYFLAGAAVMLFAAPRFAQSAEQVAVVTGIGATFIGTWLVGLATSLPELVTSLAAVRMRAYDLAVGNLFGSNAFNMTIFAILDAVQPGPPVLGTVSPLHAISAMAAVALMAVGTAALVYRSQGRLALLEPSSMLIIIGYVLTLALLLRTP